jgi:O-antigen ligase
VIGALALGFCAVLLVAFDKRVDRLALGLTGGLLSLSALQEAIARTTVKGRHLCAALGYGALFALWQLGYAKRSGSLSAGTLTLSALATTMVAVQAIATYRVLAPHISRPQRLKRSIFGALTCLGGYFVWESFATAWAPQRDVTLKLFARELCVYVGSFFLAIRFCLTRPRECRYFLQGAGAAVVLICVLMIIVAGLQGLGLLPRSFAGEQGWVRMENAGQAWRLQFPFQHHNRAGFFGMCAAFLVPVFLLSRSRFSPVAAIATACMGLVITLFAITRGAQLGLTVGVIGTAVAPWQRPNKNVVLALAGALAAACLLVLALPAQRAHWLGEVKSLVAPTGAQTSIGNRLMIQGAALGLLSERPLRGWGYGYSTFEQLAAERFPSVARDVEGMSHPHNIWLEQAFSAGIPAMLLFLGFTVCRLLALGGVLSPSSVSLKNREMLILALWFGLELAIQMYGLTNTSLRRTLGLWTYTLWAGSIVLALHAATSTFPRSTK